MKKPLVKIEDVYKDYQLPKKYLFQKAPVFRALHGINLELHQGTSFGIVGESGCGKSTLARIVMALDEPTSGTVFFDGQDLFNMPAAELKHLRRNFQMVFQDPYGSLNPRKNVMGIVAEPLDTLKEKLSYAQKKEYVAQILSEVGLNATDTDKFPHEFSGGQRQRIAIARALITRPSLIVADESVSALDVSVQAQVLNLMMDLQEKYNLTYMFISHDLSVVEYVTDQVAVIYMGQIVEQGTTKALFQRPLHPYTQTLLRAVPDVNPLNKKLKNMPVIPLFEKTLESCSFLDRCNKATRICVNNAPELLENEGQLVACFNAE
ncbi:MAG: ATP-binding cassette domain-containing protein [Deltaproteobacteria bacterium]|uniref:ABC transporter ATP-binding protein n=1 Tax=Desulfobacula sp. TaxID=2593537 RepID=UPI001998488C|nr:ATP-binding cassette domain-containing protein [Candidatus Desulfobacula maris]MBL6992915.1 ATP-binding cassette domain-containing protein [Desulfobacula sp.]